MRIWRSIKALGCVALRDGAYLMPASAEHEQALQGQADECSGEGGIAWLMAVQPRASGQGQTYSQLFDRSADYAELRIAWKDANRGASALAEPELTRLQRRLQRNSTRFGRLTFSLARPASRPRRPGPNSTSASTACSGPTSPARPGVASPRSSPTSTRDAPGRRGGACGSTGWPAPG